MCPTAASSTLGYGNLGSAQRSKNWADFWPQENPGAASTLLPTCLQQKVHGIAIKCCFLGGFVPSGPWSERDSWCFKNAHCSQFLVTNIPLRQGNIPRVWREDPLSLGLVPNIIADAQQIQLHLWKLSIWSNWAISPLTRGWGSRSVSKSPWSYLFAVTVTKLLGIMEFSISLCLLGRLKDVLVSLIKEVDTQF